MWGRTRWAESKVVGVEFANDIAAVAVRDGEHFEHQFIELDEASALRRWIAAEGLEKCPCHVVLAPATVSMLQVERPQVPGNEMAEAVRWYVNDSLDYPAEAAVIDCFDVPEDALRGRSPLVNVVAVNKREICRVVDRVRASGLALVSIDIPELSLRNLAATHSEPGKAMAMLVVEQDQGTMMIFRDNLLYLSRHIACDPALAAGDADAGSLEQVCLEIQRSLDYFESQLGQIPPRSILVHAGAGSGALFAAIGTNMSLTPVDLSMHEGARVSAGLLRAVGAAMRVEASA